ncbi:MAG: hypothetical protein ACOCTG_06115, partial [Bacteroidota bacterium]
MRLSTISTTLFAALLLVLVLPAQAQFDTEWERTSRDGAAEPTPSWFGTSTERNVAYGVVGGQERLYVASRSGDVNRIRVIDPDTGADLDDVVISTDGISGGAVAFNTIDVSDDGQIIVSNLVSPSGLFKVYAWEDESAEPREITSSELDVRAGDNIHISGSIADGTAAVYAAASNVNRVFRWLMVEDPENAGQYVFQADPQDFTLASITAWGSPGYAVGKDAGEAAFLAGGRSVTFMREYDNEATTTGYVEFAEGN